MKITAIIPARGNSKRLKRKNIVEVWGKPMLYWAIKACEDSKYDIDVWVSSEDDEILEIAKSFNVMAIKRPEELSGDHVYKQEVIRHAAKTIKESDIWISLQANSPTIKSEYIDKGIETLLNYKRDEIISVDSNLMQNAAFRIFKNDYVFQKDLSTNCGVVVCDIEDIHTIEDVNKLKDRK